MSLPPSVFPVPSRLTIASRESRLALVQSEWIAQRLRGFYPAMRVEILGMTTRGDQILDRPLAQVGGKGLFIKELEVAMQEGRADVAVHSMKDMMHPDGPTDLDVAIVGFGSGVTVGTALSFPVRSVDVLELERAIEPRPLSRACGAGP